jgi:predicted DNA-binding transcriptional regulator YafY
VLTIDYQGSYADEPTQRAVEPIGLYHYGANWHLIAFCRLRQDYRDFRTDRIQQLTETPERFSRRSRLSLQAYLDRLREAEKLEEVVVSFDKKMARFAQQERYVFGFVDETEVGGRVRMRFMTQMPTGLGQWLLMFGTAVTIESPDALRTTMLARAGELVRHYGG